MDKHEYHVSPLNVTLRYEGDAQPTLQRVKFHKNPIDRAVDLGDLDTGPPVSRSRIESDIDTALNALANIDKIHFTAYETQRGPRYVLEGTRFYLSAKDDLRVLDYVPADFALVQPAWKAVEVDLDDDTLLKVTSAFESIRDTTLSIAGIE